MNDLKFAWRQLLKNRGFTAVVVLTLALGVGATTAIFAVIDALILNPLPAAVGDRLVRICTEQSSSLTRSALESVLENTNLFAGVAWDGFLGLGHNRDGFVEELGGWVVSPNYFSLWRVPPALGRTFAQDEGVFIGANGMEGQGTAIVLSYSFWQSQFGGDSKALGKTLTLAGHQFTVVGVMPPYFFPGWASYWVPARAVPVPSDHVDCEVDPYFEALARLKRGVTLRQTQAMLDVVARRLADQHADRASVLAPTGGPKPGDLRFSITPARTMFGERSFERALMGGLVALGFVLLIACANLANLNLARTERRQQEWVVRAALGAGRVRLMGQVLTESAVLGGLSGLAALAAAQGGLKLLVSWIPGGNPQARPIHLDGAALLFALLACLLSAVVFGLAPAWQAGRVRLGESLKGAGNRATSGLAHARFRAGLVIAEVALTLVLLAGAGLMLQSVIRLLQVNLGWDPKHVLLAKLWLPGRKGNLTVRPEAARPDASLEPRIEALQHRVASLPGVEALGAYAGGGVADYRIENRGASVRLPRMLCTVGASDWFRALRIPLLAGRDFNRSDIGGAANTVVVNRAMERACWPERSAVGKRFWGPIGAKDARSYRVIGVVGNVRRAGYAQRVKPLFYRPFAPDLASNFRVLWIRTKGDPWGVVPFIRQTLKTMEPHTRTPYFVLADAWLHDSTQMQRTYLYCLLAAGGVGLFLAAIGLYGILAHSVLRRTREFGLRLALGARPRDVIVMVVTQGMRLFGLGMLAGLLATFGLTRLLRHELFGVSPLDPMALLSAALALAAVALVASYLPARRAAKLHPMEALRCE